MSVVARLLNVWLRRVEKPRMARAQAPEVLRQRMERSARLFFHAPRDTQMQWQTLEHGQASVEALEVVPSQLIDGKVLLYLHGGAFIFGSPNAYSAMIGTLAARLSVRAIIPKYRRAPEHPFPAAFDDVRSAWDGLRNSGLPAEQIVIGGDSAGGALTLSLLGQLLKEGADLPAGVFCFSPLTDMRYASESFRSNAKSDVVLAVEGAQITAEMYLKGMDATDPRVSPLFAEFAGAPPVWITAGDTEILLDDSRTVTRNMRSSGVNVTYLEEHDLPHVWPLFHNILPEARRTLDLLADWVRQLPERRDGS